MSGSTPDTDIPTLRHCSALSMVVKVKALLQQPLGERNINNCLDSCASASPPVLGNTHCMASSAHSSTRLFNKGRLSLPSQVVGEADVPTTASSGAPESTVVVGSLVAVVPACVAAGASRGSTGSPLRVAISALSRPM